MMKTTVRSLSFVLALASLSVACVGEVDPSQIALGIGEACATSTECGPGLECEFEHGRSTCQAHGRRTTETPARDAGASTTTPATDDGSGTAPAGSACTTDAQCARGLECEVEHGVGTCRAHRHGGR